MSSDWKSWFYLVGINMVVFGVEVCASASFTYIPPIMLKMGFTGTVMGLVVGIGPLLSLFIVPVIGRCSDKMTTVWPFYGHREPFIVGLSGFLIFSLIIIPYCREMAQLTGLSTLVIVAVGVVLLDLTTQSILNPCKALVSDILLETRQTEKGFTVFSFMLNSGSAFGYLITSVNWEKTKLGILLGTQEKLVFLLMAGLYAIFLCLTLTTLSLKATFVRSLRVNDLSSTVPLIKIYTNQDTLIIPLLDGVNKSDDIKNRNKQSDDKTIHVLTNGNGVKTKQRSLPASHFVLLRKSFSGVLRFCTSFIRLPDYIVRLFVADLFCWMALHAHDLFFTDYVGKVMYHGNPYESEISRRLLYDEGVRTGSWALLLQCSFAAIYSAVFQDRILRKFGERKVLLFGMAIFALCMLGTLCCTTSSYLEGVFPMEILALLSGLGVASVNTIPNNVVTHYHEDYEEVNDFCQNGNRKLETSRNGRGIGEDMAVLDAASFFSQVIPAIFLGFLVDYFDSASLYVIFAAGSAIMATIASKYVIYHQRTITRPS